MNTKLAYVIVTAAAIGVGFFAAKTWQDRSAEKSATVASTEAAPAAKPPVLTLPEFSLKNREDQPQSIKSWPGKSLVINFWATWCAPCRREIPLLMELQKQHAADGIQLVGIAVDFRDDVLKYADTMKIDYPLLIGEQDGLAAVDAFGIEAVGFPYTVFTDAQGNIVTTHIGELHKEQAEVILATVKKINSGEIAIGAARTQLNAELSNLKTAVASEG
ncbi:MAG: TlpA disulfide reductase family protein [Steroidobacteraceae bacterium]